MIREISVHPVPQNKNAERAFLIAILLSAVGFVAYFSMDKYKGIVGTVALMILTTAILFYTKYISPEFYYDISVDSDGVPMFLVRQVIGKRQTTLCRVELADITSIVEQTAKERKAHKAGADFKSYVYTPTLMPKSTYLITVNSRYEKAELRIEATEDFASLLREYSGEARLMREADTE